MDAILKFIYAMFLFLFLFVTTRNVEGNMFLYFSNFLLYFVVHTQSFVLF
ncbi:Nodule Cysteine-Rich (NCR) secreted peptide [Medicago truncatula]|uniref:Nodule Cysteine-Rich (NCR) secreted peptide n=1 Tax=Medicago truncatula TaxID=3880 RepID=A0A072V830_MEDTR|nr:Nodule Cysteine-Rich (NCR) secreted peptide [Medicago truncatula]KEH37972.1 Nodule Cysteine-Rich (NCR) secreted peptide [Medicago truncatula]